MKKTIHLLSVLLFVLLAACSMMPKIHILSDPLTPQEHLNLGVAYEEKGELDNAIREYNLAAKKLKAPAYFNLGNAYFKKGEYGKAEDYYKKAIKKDPRMAGACNNLAWLYYTRKIKLDQAEELARKAIRLSPEKSSIYEDTLKKIQELKNKTI